MAAHPPGEPWPEQLERGANGRSFLRQHARTVGNPLAIASRVSLFFIGGVVVLACSSGIVREVLDIASGTADSVPRSLALVALLASCAGAMVGYLAVVRLRGRRIEALAQAVAAALGSGLRRDDIVAELDWLDRHRWGVTVNYAGMGHHRRWTLEGLLDGTPILVVLLDEPGKGFLGGVVRQADIYVAGHVSPGERLAAALHALQGLGAQASPCLGGLHVVVPGLFQLRAERLLRVIRAAVDGCARR
jgi:hypothetical protein